MKRHSIQFGLALVLALLPTTVLARTEFFFEGPTDVRPNTEFPVTLKARIDQAINAIGITVRFEPTQLTILSTDDRDSVVRHWIERPLPSTSGTIRMEGMIPGGVGPGFTDTVIIARMMVTAPHTGLATMTIGDTQVYLHQSEPRSDVVTSRPLTLQVRTAAPLFSVLPLADAPRDIDVRLVREPLIHDGAWSLVFDVRTEQGTAAVRVRERKFGIRGRWYDATNPYRLSDQSLTSIIDVAAVDDRGQHTVRALVPLRLKVLCSVAALLCIAVAYRLYRRRRR